MRRSLFRLIVFTVVAWIGTAALFAVTVVYTMDHGFTVARCIVLAGQLVIGVVNSLTLAKLGRIEA